MRWQAWPALILLLAIALQTQAQQPDFPPLTGRVVDRAELLDPATEAQIAQRLQAHEQGTGEQLVVVTVPDLQGRSIEDYGYQLGRHWGIGQQGKDNGALLLIARDERKIRIEVGYGLEGRLTDAASALIIQNVISPAFKRGDFAAGISNGVEAMLQVLGGQAQAAPAQGQRPAEAPPGGFPVLLILFFVVMTFLRGGRRGGLLGAVLLGSAMGRRGGHRGGGFGGGFRGGGGGFGGGGASGGW
jgi:uncharacterized protein